MTLTELIRVIDGKTNITENIKIKEIKTDTRKIKKGDIFIALKGDKYDGHEYVKEAIKKGAIACIVDKEIDNSKCIKVDDTYKCLYDIGSYIRNKHNIPLIGVTGSNGKTTTKELIVHILNSKYNVLYNNDSKNNIIGVSHTLFKLNNTYDLVVMELGSNHVGEISILSNMCMPTTSIITNVGSSHLEYFKTKKKIFKEKLSIIDGMKEKKLIVNGDDKHLRRLKCYKCGTSSNNDLIAYNIYEDKNYITFKIYLDKEYKVIFNNPGRHFINDILLAIKVCLDYGINIKTIIKKIKNFKLVNKRMSIINIKDNIIINDCYNSSFESIKAGIEYMNNITDNKVFIIGEILELGKHSKKIHKKINKLLKNINKKNIFTVGEGAKYIKGNYFKDVDELVNYLKENPINDSYVYIKGSRRVNLDKVVDYLQTKKSTI
jgi:UDP-N-acetylmuramoyl-tripeptide--D-alanyl-D-alanine ligase